MLHTIPDSVKIRPNLLRKSYLREVIAIIIPLIIPQTQKQWPEQLKAEAIEISVETYNPAVRIQGNKSLTLDSLKNVVRCVNNLLTINLTRAVMAETEVAVKDKAEAKAAGKDAIKIANPKTIHDHFINNLVDAAEVAVQRKDLTPEQRFYLRAGVRSLAVNEKEGNSRALVGDSIEKIELIIEKFGVEKAQPIIEGAMSKLVSMYPKTISYKKDGIDDDFLKIVKDAMSKAVDDVSGKAKEPGVAKVEDKSQASVPAKDISNPAEKVTQKSPAAISTP